MVRRRLFRARKQVGATLPRFVRLPKPGY